MPVVLMVSKLGHCLADLLWHWRSGSWPSTSRASFPNHEDCREMVERGRSATQVRWHLGDRVLMHGKRAIVFRD